MKTTITILLVLIALNLNTQAQVRSTVRGNNFDLPSYTTARDLTNDINFGRDYFSYTSTPEIKKLESHLTQLSKLYKLSVKYGHNKFSATSFKKLTDEEKKEIRSNCRYSGALVIGYSEEDDGRDLSLEQKAESYFENIIVPYLNNDNEHTVNTQKIEADVKIKIDELFELKEAAKQQAIAKLQDKVQELKNTISERKQNKQQIITERLSDLMGTPSNLKW